MVVIDATTLLLLLRPDDVGVPRDPSTGSPIASHAERIAYLVQCLDKAKARIGIPTPVIAEAFVRSGSAGVQILAELNNHAVFKILDFDAKSALELALMTKNAIARGKKRGDSRSPYQKIKIDRQIAAIAKANEATEIYSDDKDMLAIGKEIGIPVTRTSSLPFPPTDPQLAINFDTMIESDGDSNFEEEAAEAFPEELLASDPTVAN